MSSLFDNLNFKINYGKKILFTGDISKEISLLNSDFEQIKKKIQSFLLLIFKYHLFIFQRGGSELFLEFGDEYVLKCYGLLSVDATRVNELIAQRDKHALKFFGLESSSEDELNNWDANNLEKLPLVKDFEEDFKPIQPIYDKWNVYHPDYDNC